MDDLSLTTLERYRGCLLGLAAGDALGSAIEFQSPGSFMPLTDMIGGGPFKLQPGEWTDDTSLALCLAESLLERQGFDPVDQLERYVLWYREGHLSSTGACFDIGGTTRRAIERFERTREPFCPPGEARWASNGSLMRLAPVPMAYARRPAEALKQAAASSRTTHGATVAVDACRYLAALLVGALAGTPKQLLLAPGYAPWPGGWQTQPLAPEIDEIAQGSFRRRQPPQIAGTGNAARCLEAAVWAFDRTASFREGCLLAVNLGDDADTTGAVYGQLAGALYGAQGIPATWRERLARRELIEALAEGLYRLSLELGPLPVA